MNILGFTGQDTSPLPANVTLSSTGGVADGEPAGKLTGPLQLTDADQSWAGGSIQVTLFRPEGAITGGVIACTCPFQSRESGWVALFGDTSAITASQATSTLWRRSEPRSRGRGSGRCGAAANATVPHGVG